MSIKKNLIMSHDTIWTHWGLILSIIIINNSTADGILKGVLNFTGWDYT